MHFQDDDDDDDETIDVTVLVLGRAIVVISLELFRANNGVLSRG